MLRAGAELASLFAIRNRNLGYCDRGTTCGPVKKYSIQAPCTSTWLLGRVSEIGLKIGRKAAVVSGEFAT